MNYLQRILPTDNDVLKARKSVMIKKNADETVLISIRFIFCRDAM